MKIKQISLPTTGSWDLWGYKSEEIALNSGNNNITYKYDTGDSGWINLDYIIVNTSLSKYYYTNINTYAFEQS